jgi:UPF0176 protein
MAPTIAITASYAFVPFSVERLQHLQMSTVDFGEVHGMRGLVLLAEEGINSTVSGSPSAIAAWKEFVRKNVGVVDFKDSQADDEPFRRWSVKIKPEIVGIKDAAIRPSGKHRHLSPEEWNAMLNREDVVVVDARNDYEIAIGKFRGATDPGIRHFSDFPDVAETVVPKDKKVLLYCTGGIRCEKAIHALESRGYGDVYQLDGGILRYLEEFPDGEFEGECFVFDHRVAVDKHLRPSQTYALCPHCGDPAATVIECPCGAGGKVCAVCNEILERRTCSKRCANEQMVIVS